MAGTERIQRIWAQGATDQQGHRHYLAALLPHVKASTDPGFEVEFHTMTPSVTTVHALSEFRFSREVIRSAIRAEQQGYAAFYMNHFQDVGLYEARASVNIPVLGLGETSLLHACTLGRKLGLIAINPAFVPLHADQVARYGLGARVAGIRTVDASIGQWMDAFADPARKADMWERFQREARVLLSAGADVIVPTGGIPMMLFGGEPGAHVDGAPVVNGVTILVKAAEMAIKLRAMAGLGPSRVAQSGFALPSAQALAEFMEHG